MTKSAPYNRKETIKVIHQYKLNGYNIVLDVHSGSVHVVDDVAYDIIEMYENSTEEQIVEAMMKKYGDRPDVNEEEIRLCLSDIRELIAQKKLFSEDIYKDIAFDFKNKSRDIKALCLHVAHTCNLNCSYCFASQGKYHGERALMSFEVGKRALDFLIENSGNHVNLEVDFFGGEPLMNFDVVKELVAYARSIEKEKGKNFRFTLTTNGVGVNDDVIEFANRECHNVVMSIDGRKEVHDRLRKDYQGNGSYDVIVPKFTEFAKRRTSAENIGNGGYIDYYVRGTYTHASTDFTEDIFHLADLGFSQLSMEPVVCSPDDPYALTEKDLPVLYRQYEILAEEMLKRKKEGHPITFYHYMLDLTHGPCIHKRIAGCGSGCRLFRKRIECAIMLQVAERKEL